MLYGSRLYRIDSAGTATACVGDTIPSAGTAMMSDNGVQLAVMVGTALFVVGSTNSIGSFRVTDGTYDAGTNQITDIQVNSVSVIDTGAPIDWRDSDEATAGAIAAAINDYTSSPDYTAETSGAKVIIKAVDAGTSPNGFGIALTLTGDVTVTPPSSSMSGGAATSTTVMQVTNGNYPAAGISRIDYVDGQATAGVVKLEFENDPETD